MLIGWGNGNLDDVLIDEPWGKGVGFGRGGIGVGELGGADDQADG